MGDVSFQYITEDQFVKYCDEIIDGKNTEEAAKEIGKNIRNVFKWLEFHATDAQRQYYARACSISADTIAAKGFAEAFNTNDDVQRSRLKWDACRWEAGKRNPKKYGDRTVLAGDPEAPLGLAAELQNARNRT